MANTGYASDTTSTTWEGWSSTGNTANNRWYQRLTGPTYRVAEATLVLVSSRTHKPGKYANIGGVQFKRTTRVGKRHYYQAMA